MTEPRWETLSALVRSGDHLLTCLLPHRPAIWDSSAGGQLAAFRDATDRELHRCKTASSKEERWRGVEVFHEAHPRADSYPERQRPDGQGVPRRNGLGLAPATPGRFIGAPQPAGSSSQRPLSGIRSRQLLSASDPRTRPPTGDGGHTAGTTTDCAKRHPSTGERVYDG
jgi:hypothetical protein